jgi:hypothetical protein
MKRRVSWRKAKAQIGAVAPKGKEREGVLTCGDMKFLFKDTFILTRKFTEIGGVMWT